jgi:hypothetical protein
MWCYLLARPGKLQVFLGCLMIYYGPNGTGYLLVSSQGDHTIAVLERGGNNAHVGSVVIGDTDTIDQANETDGADVLNVPLGPDYPMGLLVVQDGANDPQVVMQDDAELENISTNFKFVPWHHVANTFPEPLLIDPFSVNPRGPLTERLDLLLNDIQALVQAQELSRLQAFGFTLVLQGARALVAQGHPRVAIWLLQSLVRQVESLERKNWLEQGIATSLATFANGIIRTLQQAS